MTLIVMVISKLLVLMDPFNYVCMSVRDPSNWEGSLNAKWTKAIAEISPAFPWRSRSPLRFALADKISLVILFDDFEGCTCICGLRLVIA